MNFDSPIDLSDAVKQLLARKIMPTSMTSAELRGVSAGMKRQALFSAQTLETSYLETIRDAVASVLLPTQEDRPDRGLTTVGLHPATAAESLRNRLADLGYSPKPGEEGTIKDLSSNARINLVISTNVQTAQGAGELVRRNADEDAVDLYPALELLWEDDSSEVPRGQKRTKEGLMPDPRNGWPARWMAAAAEADDTDAERIFRTLGRMVALKSSGIWRALGQGAGGYEDTLGNPYPPYAFNSSIVDQEVDREEAEALKLLQPGEIAEGADFDFSTLFSPAKGVFSK